MSYIKPFCFVLAFLIALGGVNGWGVHLKEQAYQGWLEKAELETTQITNTSFYWMSLFHTQLRGLAALFYGSDSITEIEFFNALELIEEIESESVIPLSNVALINIERQASSGLVLSTQYSTDIFGNTDSGSDLIISGEIKTVVNMAVNNPENVQLGPMYLNSHGDRLLPLAIRVPNAERDGVLLSVVNVSDFFNDLATLYFPEGLQLRLTQSIQLPEDEPSERYDSITVSTSFPSDRRVTFFYPTRSGNAEWDYYWDIGTDFQGGVDTKLGDVIQIGGSALVTLAFLIMSFLAYQNRQVNFMVKLRTQELAETTEALRNANKELEVLASHDCLTSALNRGSFLEIAEKTHALSSRRKSPLSMIMIDVDYFKSINDRFGHAGGDSVLVALVGVFNDVLREADYLGRIGGEEFALLLWDTGIDEATLVAERLKRAISAEKFLINEKRYGVTVSMGISELYHDKPDTISSLMKRADDAMYSAKKQGRNRYAVFTENMAH